MVDAEESKIHSRTESEEDMLGGSVRHPGTTSVARRTMETIDTIPTEKDRGGQESIDGY